MMDRGLHIRLATLPLGKSRLQGGVDFALLDAAGETETCRVEAVCDLDHLGARIHVRGEAAGEADSHCHRCLDPFRRRIAATFEVTLQRSEAGTEAGGDVEYVPEGTVEYDLAPRVREALLLEEPLRLLCTPECRGLCPQCGGNRNREVCGCEAPLDPRWAPLAALRSRTDHQA
jgi:DUF177 domain-containing protein